MAIKKYYDSDCNLGVLVVMKFSVMFFCYHGYCD